MSNPSAMPFPAGQPGRCRPTPASKAAIAAWTYLFQEPFAEYEAFLAHLEQTQTSRDPLFFAVVDSKTRRAVGSLALMRIDPAHGVIELGSIHYSPLVQRTPAATEAQYLLMKLVFDALGYRRFEWKCDSLNAPFGRRWSTRAARATRRGCLKRRCRRSSRR